MNISAPRLFAVVQISDSSVVFTSDRWSKANSFIHALPDVLIDCFALVRYDPNPEYAEVYENNNNK